MDSSTQLTRSAFARRWRNTRGKILSVASRRQASEQERRCEQICLRAGARHFFGIQRAFPRYGLEALCLFAGPRGSCLALPLTQLSEEAVRRVLMRQN